MRPHVKLPTQQGLVSSERIDLRVKGQVLDVPLTYTRLCVFHCAELSKDEVDKLATTIVDVSTLASGKGVNCNNPAVIMELLGSSQRLQAVIPLTRAPIRQNA